jgi:phage terminase large subunit-like protein
MTKKAQQSSFKSLGWVAIDWIETYLVHGPGDVQGEPIVLDDEQATFILRAYEIDKNGKRTTRRAFFSRSKGRAKSELAGMIVCFEALGPARFDHFLADGTPVGRPVQYPFIRCLATEESQSGNTYDNVRYMLEHVKTNFGSDYPGIDIGLTRTILRGGGEIIPSTAASASKDGGKESFAVADETHLYSSPELKRMHETVRRNLAKRKAADPWMLETSTMYAVGEDSIAEQTHRLWVAMQEGRAKNPGLLFDHIQAPEVPDLQNTEQLKKALAVAYGPAFAWLDIDRLINEIQDPMTKGSDARRYFLNQPSTDTDKYMDSIAWNKAAEPEQLADGTTVVLGYDGSRKDDATALIACRVEDGKIFQIACWERPPGPAGYGWEVPRIEVDEVVRETFEKYDVRSIWADPSGWQSYLDAWNTTFVDRVVAVYPASQRKLMAQGLDRFLEDTLEGRLKHDGSPELTRHVLNAIPARYGQVSKPSQTHKIDGLIAAVLAYLGRTDAQLNQPEVKNATQFFAFEV